MSEKLIFPIGFDLEEGVKEASKEWKSTYQKQLQKAIDDKPLKAKIELETKGLDLGKLKEFNKISKEMVAASKANAKMQRDNIAVQERQRLADERVAAAHERTLASVARRKKAEEGLNRVYKTQSSYLQRLAQRMIAYASVTQAFSFVRNIREVTAEFELQRVALGSIIGDMNEANKMFEQIKAAAVKSPFQIKELVSYTKQLAAYKIEQDELFETTQRLADVSAGLGVGMERLVLAYGQIRATGYLRASEVRQLTEAGIPIVEELAKKMSQLRGETVSAAEVMGLISERAISFGMVKEVFDDMTSAGGMFYKMQEKQAETLAGQWSNLQDSISIMYEEIGNTEGVNNSIKGMIGLVKSLAENWRDMYSIAQSLSVAMGVYYVAMKNAAVASTALAASEARLAALEMTREARMPRLIALMLGQNKAITVTIALNKALVFSQKKALMATTALGKAFWRLTTAMLSNPYTAVLAALAGITFAIVKFSTKTKTTQERIDDLNKSVASLTDLKNDVKPLVDELDALSQKANKTAEEQKRLNQVTQELARIYPEAINGIREFGNEAKVSAAKVAMLYGAEAKALQEGIKINLQYNQDELKKEQAKLARINKALLDKTYTETTYGFGGASTTTTYTYTTEELKELAKQADESREKIASLNNSIKEGRIALGLQKSDLEKAVDGFNTWQKELASITEGKNLKGEGIRLFDDESITQINKLTDATARVAEEYDKLAKEKERVDKALKSEGAKADKDTYAKLQERLGKINEGMSGLYDFLKKYGALDLIKSDDKTQKSAEQALKDELAAVEKIYKRYQDLRKLKSETDTQSILANEFKGVSLTTLSKAYSPEQMIEVYQKALAEAQRLGKKDLVLEIQTKIGEFNVAEEQRKLEKSLKDLSDQISRTKTAKEFFDRMLGLTGDKQLSATLTLSVYGTTGDDLQKLMTKQVTEAFKNLPEGFDITKAMLGGGKFDYNLLESWIEKLPEQDRKSAQSIVDNWRKTNQDIITDLYKTYEEFLSFEERKTRVVEKENAERMRIINSGLPMAEQEKLVGASQKRENKALADIAIEEFKASADWAKSFEDLENLATPTIERLMAKLKEFIDTQKDLTPEQLKTLTNEYKKLYDGLIARNPFKAMTDGIKEYVAATKDIKTAKDRVETAQEELRIATERKAAAEQNFKTSQDVATAGREYASAIKEYNKASQNAADADKDLGDALDAQKTALNKTVQGFNAASSAISNFGSIITDITEILGIAEDSEVGAFIKDLVKWLGVMAGVLGTVAAIIAIIEAELAPLLAIAAGIAAIGAAISFFSNAKVRKANKEIERQQDLIDKLEKSYERLEKQIENTFGSDYLKNYNDRLAILYAEQEAYLKQAEKERSKGKKEDEEKTKDYLDSAYEVGEQIADMQKEVQERFAGTDLASAARDFAQSWIDAYKEFGSTTDAMKEKFHDMIQNMVVESIAGKMMQQLLQPVFDAIDEYSKDGELDEREIATIADLGIGLIDTMDESMTSLVERLRAAGYDIRQSTSGLTGISKDIASASEESILGLAAGINTQNFYISQVPPKLDTIIALLQGGGVQVGGGVNMQDLITIQNQHLSHLPNIAQNTAETVARCERAANACERMADQLDRVIKPRGTQATHTVNTSL